ILRLPCSILLSERQRPLLSCLARACSIRERGLVRETFGVLVGLVALVGLVGLISLVATGGLEASVALAGLIALIGLVALVGLVAFVVFEIFVAFIFETRHDRHGYPSDHSLIQNCSRLGPSDPLACVRGLRRRSPRG